MPGEGQCLVFSGNRATQDKMIVSVHQNSDHAIHDAI